MALPLLAGKRIAVLGSASGLGLAVAAAAEAAGAEVLGIDGAARFEHLSALYRIEPGETGAAEAVAAALPEGLDGLALLPAMPEGPPARQLAEALALPRLLGDLMGPRMAPGGAILVRGAGDDAQRAGALGAIRAGVSLRPGQGAAFAARWGLDTEPTGTPRLIGWAMQAWAMGRATRWPRIRVNALLTAAPDGRLPTAQAAALGLDPSAGPALAARAAVFLLSDLAAGLTGASLAADGGAGAQLKTSLEGL